MLTMIDEWTRYDPWASTLELPLVPRGGPAPLIDALLGTARKVAYACDVWANDARMTAVQAGLAAHVARAPYGLPVSSLAESLGVTKQAVTGLVDRMEYSGLVMRTRHELDGRCTTIVLTERGAREVARVARRLAGIDRDIRLTLKADRCERLEEALGLIASVAC